MVLPPFHTWELQGALPARHDGASKQGFSQPPQRCAQDQPQRASLLTPIAAPQRVNAHVQPRQAPEEPPSYVMGAWTGVMYHLTIICINTLS